MGCDMVVALGRATVDGCTRFGQNCSRPADEHTALCRLPGRAYAPGEQVRAQHLELPQARQTFTVLGCRPAGCWGYSHGINEHGVAAGCASLHNKLRSPEPGLVGSDLVRLVLERGKSARHAVELLGDLLECYGQGIPGSAETEADHAFLLADGREAFVVETAAQHWVYQEILEVRAVSNVCTVRQDWNRISPGLGAYAIEQGWWPADGTKLDFADALSEQPTGEESALRRWGRATLLLEQQNGHIDTPFVRRLLSDHYEGTHFEVDPLSSRGGPLPLCQHVCHGSGGTATAASFLVQLSPDPDRLPQIGVAVGPPCLSLYFPVFVDGDLPDAFTQGYPEGGTASMAWRLRRLEDLFQAEVPRWPLVRERLGRLQEDLDREAELFLSEAAGMRQRGEKTQLANAAAAVMRRNLEQFDEVLADLLPRRAALGPRLHPVS